MSDPVAWCEIDLAAYGHNLGELRKLCQPTTRLMAVVKANGYGHGATEIAGRALESGADALGVARVGEAEQLRRAGIAAPILILGFTPATAADVLMDQELSQAIFSYRSAAALSEQAEARGKRIRAHLKIDTGMGRVGLMAHSEGTMSPDGLPAGGDIEAALKIARLPGLELEGIFTHFASADSADKSHADRQLEQFLAFIERLEEQGLRFQLRHAANSAALIEMAESHLDMVRPGIATYGLYPSAEVDASRVELRPVLQWKSRIIHLKTVPAGFGVSYGTTYKTAHPTTLATVPVGYADGLTRRLSSRGQLLVRGRRVPIVGRVCMDMTVIDVGEVPGVEVEDEVVLIGDQNGEFLSADEMASSGSTINYEVVSTITPRIPRIYLG